MKIGPKNKVKKKYTGTITVNRQKLRSQLQKMKKKKNVEKQVERLKQ